MKITKEQLRQIIEEEIAGISIKEKPLQEQHFDLNTGKPLSTKGWFIAARNPKHPFHKQAKQKLDAASRTASGDVGAEDPEVKQQNWKNLQGAFVEAYNGVKSVKKALKKISDLELTGADELQKEMDRFAQTLMMLNDRWRKELPKDKDASAALAKKLGLESTSRGGLK